MRISAQTFFLTMLVAAFSLAFAAADDTIISSQAEEPKPASPILNYNEGVDRYRDKDFDQAIRSFRETLLTENKELEKRANYNLGNSAYQKAMTIHNNDLSSAVGLLEQSLQYFRRALELDHEDEDAKFNYELTQKKLEELKERLKQQQQQQNKQEQNQQQKQQDQPQSQKQQEQNQQEQTQQQQPQEQEASGQKQQKFEQPSRKEEEEAGKPGEKERGMSEEEAKMLLNSYLQDEATFGDLSDKQKSQPVSVDKDW